MICKPYIPANPNGILLLGEAPGEHEEKTGMPFVGPAGQELDRICRDAGINRYDCWITNVFDERPPQNELDKWCLGVLELRKILKGENAEYEFKAHLPFENSPSYLTRGADIPVPPISRGRYIHPRHWPVFARLNSFILETKPRVIVALGNTALWALTGVFGIAKYRGVVIPGYGTKILPTFHPAAILRQWQDRPIMVADLIKARKELAFPEIRRPQRTIYIEPEFDDVIYPFNSNIIAADMLSIDIETARGQITCIGFAWSPSEACVIPILDRRKKDYSYWNPVEELLILNNVRRWLALPCPKLFQNGLYDIQYIWKTWGFPIRNCLHDTMIRHHAIQPEMRKDLGRLGSLYTQEQSWKLLRTSAGDKIKRDE